MKALRVIGNVLIGIILFGLIFVLTFTRSTKNFLEKDLILGVVRGKITDTIKEQSGKVSDKSQELLNEMLDDNSANDIIQMVISNFGKYQEDKTGFKVSDADAEKIYSYALKYKDTIIEISGNELKNVTDEEFKKIFSAENINKLADEVFGSMEKDLGDGVDVAIKTYNKLTSKTIMIALIGSIVFFVLLLLLLNWSLFKWMLVTGIDLIISGVIISLIYVAGLLFNDMIASVDEIKEMIGEINLNSYLIWGLSEILLGIALVVIYNVIKNKKDDTTIKLNNL